MTKADIVEKIMIGTGLTKRDSAEMMEALFSIMKSTLEQGENLKLAGFGNFEVKQKHDRRGRNPQTGETITISSRRVVTFKPSALLRQAING
ncbi:MAG: integration host factor subunit alpha [Desulfuromonadales bacterium]|nr:integration host factor subunit alpha [Desulfuromonadales bacterium]